MLEGLEIAVRELPAMQRLERTQHAQHDLNRFGNRKGGALENLSQRFALQQLHSEEQLAVLFADFVNLADVGMIDGGRRAGLGRHSRLRACSSVLASRMVLMATGRLNRSSSAA